VELNQLAKPLLPFNLCANFGRQHTSTLALPKGEGQSAITHGDTLDGDPGRGPLEVVCGFNPLHVPRRRGASIPAIAVDDSDTRASAVGSDFSESWMIRNSKLRGISISIRNTSGLVSGSCH